MIKAPEQFDVQLIPVSDIWVQPDFNCRDVVSEESVLSLATDIMKCGGNPNGLQTPIVVQPWESQPGYTYRLIRGHRRFAAVNYLRWKSVPAFVHTDLDEPMAAYTNLMENLERDQLNIMEEARGIQHIYPLGETVETIAAELHQSRSWVRRRLFALQMPFEIQQMLASGRLSQSDLDVLSQYRGTTAKMVEHAQKILEAKLDGHAKAKKVRDSLKRGAAVKGRCRTKTEVREMSGTLRTMGVTGFPMRLLAWVMGGVETEEMVKEVKEEKKRLVSKSNKNKANGDTTCQNPQ